MVESQVHVTQAHKGALSSIKPEQDPYATPPHHSLHTSDEDPLSTPYQSPRDSMQLEDDLSSPGRLKLKAENSEYVAGMCLQWHISALYDVSNPVHKHRLEGQAGRGEGGVVRRLFLHSCQHS